MTEQKNITEMTLTELKALAYDQIALLEQSQRNLQIINDEIAKRQEQDQAQAMIEE